MRLLLAVVDPHGAIGTGDGLVVGGWEVWVIGSSGRRTDNDGSCQVLGWAAWLVDGIRCLLCNAAWPLHLPERYHSGTARATVYTM